MKQKVISKPIIGKYLVGREIYNVSKGIYVIINPNAITDKTVKISTNITRTGGEGVLGMVLGGLTQIGDATEQQAHNNINSRRAYKYNIMSMREQADIQNRQTEFNMTKQKEMWDATNYGAQKKHMEAAGLNPALMYGMGGGGGATANITTGSGGGGTGGAGQGSAPNGMDIAQLMLLKAQKENIEADTANKKADVPVKEATVPNIEADTKNKGKMHSQIEATIQNIAQDTMKKVNEVEQLRIQNKINGQSADDQIKQYKWEAINEVVKNSLLYAQINNTQQQTAESKSKVILNQEQVKKWYNEVSLGWEELGQDERRTKVMELLGDFATDIPTQTMLKLTSSIGEIIQMGTRPGTTPIKGFRR